MRSFLAGADNRRQVKSETILEPSMWMVLRWFHATKNCKHCRRLEAGG